MLVNTESLINLSTLTNSIESERDSKLLLLLLFPTSSTNTETIKIYDGYNSLRKRLFRTITVNKKCSKDELLLAAMRAFVVTQVSDVIIFCQENVRVCGYIKNLLAGFKKLLPARRLRQL